MDKSYRIYLDVCCLNRPFDDWTQERVRLEGECIMTIISLCESRQCKIISSSAIQAEINQNTNLERLINLRKILSVAKVLVLDSFELRQRIQEIQELGFTEFDAAHLASAERARADIFLTTDDRLLKRGKFLSDILRVEIDNPLQWLSKII